MIPRYVMVFAMLTFLLCAKVAGQENDRPDDTQIRLVDVIELSSLHEDIDPNTAVISPDASTIVWNNEQNEALCLYTFADGGTVCTSYPRGLNSIYDKTWSPDNRTIAFTEIYMPDYSEPDIWLFEIESLRFTNRTDDNVVGHMDGEPNFDLMPLWDTKTGDLYFFREEGREETQDESCIRPITIQRIEANALFSEKEPEIVIHFELQIDCSAYIMPVHANEVFDTLNGMADISPDGRYIAVIMRPYALLGPVNTVWLFNLEKHTVEHILSPDDLTHPSLSPEWFPAMMYPSGLAWAGENLVVSAFDIVYAVGPMDNVYYYDVETGLLTVMVDATDTDMETFYNIPDDDGYAPVHNMPSYATVLSNDNALLYTYVTDTPPPRISVLPLPPSEDGDVPIHLGVVDETIAPKSDLRLTSLSGEDKYPDPAPRISSSGENNQYLRVIMLGLLFTFERSQQ